MKLSYFAKEIRENIDFVDVMRKYGVETDRTKTAICPFHNEKTGSFKVHNNRGKCFGCGWSGDNIQFVKDLFSVSFFEAVEKINNDFSMGLPIGKNNGFFERVEQSYKRRDIETARKEKTDREENNRKERGILIDRLILYEHAIKELSPKCPDDDFDHLWIEAITNIDFIKYRLDLNQIQQWERGEALRMQKNTRKL